jgi:hypothetical protein
MANVVRLPVALLEGPGDGGPAAPAPVALRTAPVTGVVEPALPDDEPETAVIPAMPAALPARPANVVNRLHALGVPGLLLGRTFAAEAAAAGTYAALTRILSVGLIPAPEVPSAPGDVLVVVGPGVETLRAARSLAASLGLDPDRVQWAARGELAALAQPATRMTTVDAAAERRREVADEGELTIVAVDAPLRTDGYWVARMLEIWSPAAVWAVVDATRNPEDVEPWLRALPRVDALMVQDSDLSSAPAAVLERIDLPVALLDGVPATPHRWASVLCERLEKQPG